MIKDLFVADEPGRDRWDVTGADPFRLDVQMLRLPQKQLHVYVLVVAARAHALTIIQAGGVMLRHRPNHLRSSVAKS
jgi:hypothetical protein